jgi:integrase
MTRIRPLDALTLPPHLDGSAGTNRADPGRPNLLGATDDLAALRAFLGEYAASPATLRTYRKEAERLLLWAVIERGRPLSSLTREDLAAYAEFLRDPQPADRWCGKAPGRTARRHDYDQGWRPFAGPLSPASRRAALAIVNSLLSYLVQGGYLAGNPMALVRRPNGHGGPGASGGRTTPEAERRRVARRTLDEAQWQALRAAVEALPATTPRERAEAERARFVLALLYFLALRVGEAASHTMGAFVQVRGGWVFCVRGKGGKQAEVPVHEELLAALRRYRASLSLPPLPPPGDPTSLLLSRRGRRGITARRISQVLKGLFARAAQDLAARGQDEGAEGLRRASAHWLRHTSLTRQVDKGIPLLHVKANARHGKLDTTLLYVHADDEARRKEMSKLTW